MELVDNMPFESVEVTEDLNLTTYFSFDPNTLRIARISKTIVHFSKS